MKRGLVLVEGQTEERFVNECLGPYLWPRGLALTAKIVTTRRPVGRAHAKGGVHSFAKIQRDLRLLCHDTDAAVITTVFDYYALPSDVPGMGDRPAADAHARVAHVEAAWAATTDDHRFVPHLVLHELEAWVFAAPACLEPWMFDDDDDVTMAIAVIARAYAGPEHINEDPATAPSKQLLRAFTAYQKALHGPLAISAIGIDRIRAVCPHFDQWLVRLEAIAAAPP
jgi:hypothetical protein